MASKTTIAAVLAYLHELYPSREISAATAEAWALTFAGWDDATLEACARRAATTPGRTFFPTPGEITALASAPVFDSSALLRQIAKLATYNPNVGMIPPNVGQVREALGDLIADAYASAGTDRLASEDETTRSIAERDFAKALELYAATPATPRVLVASAPEARRISRRGAPAEPLSKIVQRAIPESAGA